MKAAELDRITIKIWQCAHKSFEKVGLISAIQTTVLSLSALV